MRSIRRLASILWLALALLVGQQAAALHDLGHATERLSHKQDSKTPPTSCDQCFACAELSGAVGVTVQQVPVVAACTPRAAAPIDHGVVSPARLAYRSRAPPALL
jgi:hypothetical protein